MRISTIVTTFNHEKYINQCLDNILCQQGNFEMEVVVGDDCSTDKTLQIVQQYNVTHPEKIIVVPAPQNLGITKNLKRCLDNCSGDYIAICEGDDYWIDNQKLQKQYTFLKEHENCSMCFSQIYLLYEDTGELMLHPDQVSLNKKRLTTKDLVKRNFIGNFSCCMYRTDSVRKLRDEIFDVYTVDWMFNIAMGEIGDIGFLEEPLSVYRIREGGAWSGKSEIEKLRELQGLIDVYNKCLNYEYDDSFSQIKKDITVEINRLLNVRNTYYDLTRYRTILKKVFVKIFKFF
jgi:glycosyltransferase involved in cell wall biosynthesis